MIRIRNKKGVIGRILTTIPVMIMLFVLMALFLLVSGWMSMNRVEAPASIGISSSNILLREVVNAEGKSETVFDAYAKLYRYPPFEEMLINLIKEDLKYGIYGDEGLCLFLTKTKEKDIMGDMYDVFLFKGINEESIREDVMISTSWNLLRSSWRAYRDYASKFSFEYITKDGEKKTLYVQAYYGRCIGGEVI